MPVSAIHHARCLSCGVDAMQVAQAGDGRCSDVVACAGRVSKLPSPYDISPRALEPAQNGFIWCDKCDGVFDVKHACSLFGLAPQQVSVMSLWWEISRANRRAEFAESILFGIFWDHAIVTGGNCGCPTCEGARR